MRCFQFICVCSLAGSLSATAAPAWGQTVEEAATSTPDDETRALPASSEAALKQAESAYEYGDMPLVVESARVVTDGTLQASPLQRAQALRLLGIGLYVTGRLSGAQTAFEQLLQLAPETQLNPATTRPEIVTFFYQIRRARIDDLRKQHEAARPNAAFCLLPPVGQFQNGDTTKGWVLLVAEAATFITATATFVIANSWREKDETACPPELRDERCQDRTDTYNKLKTAHEASSVAFALTYAYGVVDAMISRNRQPSEEELLRSSPPRVSVALLPNGAALSLRF